MVNAFNPDEPVMQIAKKTKSDKASCFFLTSDVGQAAQPQRHALTTPSIDLTSPAACQVAPADLALVAALAKRRAQIAALKASLIVPGHDSIATPQAHKQKPARGVFGSV